MGGMTYMIFGIEVMFAKSSDNELGKLAKRKGDMEEEM